MSGFTSNPQPNQLARIIVGPGDKPHDEDFVWSSAAGMWIGRTIDMNHGTDQGFTETKVANWGYTVSANSTASFITAAVIDRLSELMALGITLQDKASCRINAGVAGNIVHIAPWFYEFNDGDMLAFANDVGKIPLWPSQASAEFGNPGPVNDPPSGTVRQTDFSTFFDTGDGVHRPYPPVIGKGNTLVGTGVSGFPVPILRTDWADVAFRRANPDGTLSATPAIPSKDVFYVVPYAYNGTPGALDANAFSVNVGLIAQYSYKMRLVMKPV